jgi:transposase-like protein
MGMAMITSYPQDWKEARRLRAFNLAQQGWKQCEIANALGVSRPAVSQWLASAREFGRGGIGRASPYRGAAQADPCATSDDSRISLARRGGIWISR